MKRLFPTVLFVSSLTLNWLSSAVADDAAPAPSEPPPLPFHCIEGYGGGAITPIAYLINPRTDGGAVGLPSVAFSYVNLSQKNLLAFTLTETLLGRIELGYGADRLFLGKLPDDIQNATGINIDQSYVWLHNFNLRVLALPEGSFGLPLPAFTTGVHFKYNDGISGINSKVHGALDSIGYHRDWGTDFTFTATKAFVPFAGHPLILTAGGRVTEAANLGFLGFSNQWNATFESNAVFLPTSWLVLAYEFRQKADPYSQIPGIVEGESDWHAFDASWIVNSHMTVVAGYGIFGTLANSTADNSWWLQFKYEF